MTNGDKFFLPFHSIKDQETIVIDGLHPRALTLSHWKGANTHASIAADTSGEIVINALKKNLEGIHASAISATHFDIDGFVGVFALFYPELALEKEDILIEMARIGDFREYNPTKIQSTEALKLCCWMNKVEKDQFYRPFEAKDELKSCIPKFNYFLAEFPKVLQNIEHFRKDWEEEYELVQTHLQLLQSRVSYPSIGLIQIEALEPLHYYALFSETEGKDIVLSCYERNRYELEYKYTSWIDLASRPNLPRIDLRPLAAELNEIEETDYCWKVDQITDTGPILRLENRSLSKAERFANPFERVVYSSAIPKEVFIKVVIDFFQKGFENTVPKRFWTWDEMRQLSKK